MSDVISIFPAKKILHALTENFTVSTLQTAMQTDPKTVDLIRTLEEKYMRENNITVDKSVSEEAARYLDVPVAVTLPVPDNLYPEHLELLHYKQDGIWEKEMVRDNKDGTITFTVIDLGIFVLVKKA